MEASRQSPQIQTNNRKFNSMTGIKNKKNEIILLQSLEIKSHMETALRMRVFTKSKKTTMIIIKLLNLELCH